MASFQVAIGERIIDPMIALAGCSTEHRIVVAGSKSIELMLQLHHRGYLRAAATANCGRPAGQYDVALVDWRRRTLRSLETTLDWLVNFLKPDGVLVVWVDAQKPARRSRAAASSSSTAPCMSAAAHLQRAGGKLFRFKKRRSRPSPAWTERNKGGGAGNPATDGPAAAFLEGDSHGQVEQATHHHS
jgi:hypothetical protein